jgi:hypothetical protein
VSSTLIAGAKDETKKTQVFERSSWKFNSACQPEVKPKSEKPKAEFKEETDWRVSKSVVEEVKRPSPAKNESRDAYRRWERRDSEEYAYKPYNRDYRKPYESNRKPWNDERRQYNGDRT